MTDDGSDNLILREIRALRADMADVRDGMRGQMADLKDDVSLLRKEGVATRQVLLDAIVNMSVRLTRLESRIAYLGPTP